MLKSSKIDCKGHGSAALTFVFVVALWAMLLLEREVYLRSIYGI